MKQIFDGNLIIEKSYLRLVLEEYMHAWSVQNLQLIELTYWISQYFLSSG